jgi:hypothetical protein
MPLPAKTSHPQAYEFHPRGSCAMDHREQDALEAPTHYPEEILARARQAANRLVSGHAWSDWVAVGRALAIGKTEAMREAHTNKPDGRLYAAAMARWLTRVGLDRVVGDRATRSHLLDLIEHLEAVEAWRRTLPLNRRVQLNHPRGPRPMAQGDGRSRP